MSISTDFAIKNSLLQVPDPARLGRVGVLMGGDSSERKISLKSGKAVFEALSLAGCSTSSIVLDTHVEEKVKDRLRQSSIDVAFLALHGSFGEDGTIQAILENLGIPYTGSGVEASRLAINKGGAQKIFQEQGVPVPSFVFCVQGQGQDVNAEKSFSGKFPVFVKPACEGSSIGITFVETPGDLPAALKHAYQYGPG